MITNSLISTINLLESLHVLNVPRNLQHDSEEFEPSHIFNGFRGFLFILELVCINIFCLCHAQQCYYTKIDHTPNENSYTWEIP